MSLTRCLQRATLCAAVIAPLTVAAQTDTTKKNYEFSGNLGFSQTGGNANLVALNGGHKYKYVRQG
jgi:putative salt-induced outer membrane protein YdiY